jgi:crotonobetainyl-CoA:carnitine CoA-transferase CaiB-like acyl-CoA transferase
MVGYPEEQRTTGFMAFGLGDTTQSIQAVIGALAAIAHRERTGEGQFVDMGQIASLCASLGEPLVDFQLNGRAIGLCGNRHPRYSPHGIYPCDAGRRWVALAVRDDLDWQALCRVMGRDDWSRTAALRTATGRRAAAAEVDLELGRWMHGEDRDALVERLCAAGVPAAPVLELAERNAHPVYAGREMMVDHRGSGFDACRIYATPWRFTATPPVISRPTPAIGEHNDYVFRELLGLDEAEIASLKDAKVLV